MEKNNLGTDSLNSKFLSSASNEKLLSYKNLILSGTQLSYEQVQELTLGALYKMFKKRDFDESGMLVKIINANVDFRKYPVNEDFNKNLISLVRTEVKNIDELSAAYLIISNIAHLAINEPLEKTIANIYLTIMRKQSAKIKAEHRVTIITAEAIQMNLKASENVGHNTKAPTEGPKDMFTRVEEQQILPLLKERETIFEEYTDVLLKNVSDTKKYAQSWVANKDLVEFFFNAILD